MKPKFWNKGKLYLSKKDQVLMKIIDSYPNDYLSTNINYFHCLLNSIIGQQISVKAANAIRTTDTFPKLYSEKIKYNEKEKIYINGIAKGSGLLSN